MGLSICFDMRMPRETPDDRIAEILSSLHRHAATVQLNHRTPMYQLKLGELLERRTPSWTDYDFFFHTIASVTREMRDHSSDYKDEFAEREAATGFVVHPGRGCEAAAFGFVRPLLDSAPSDAKNTDWNTWCLYGCCKTQYASAVSEEHFVRCHLAIVELLDQAVRLGVDVTVRDEGGYWETRSKDHLLGEVETMNRLVAAAAGALHDTISPRMRVEGSIFQHSDFERLETLGSSDGSGPCSSG
jgi:hypothetical protein